MPKPLTNAERCELWGRQARRLAFPTLALYLLLWVLCAFSSLQPDGEHRYLVAFGVVYFDRSVYFEQGIWYQFLFVPPIALYWAAMNWVFRDCEVRPATHWCFGADGENFRTLVVGACWVVGAPTLAWVVNDFDDEGRRSLGVAIATGLASAPCVWAAIGVPAVAAEQRRFEKTRDQRRRVAAEAEKREQQRRQEAERRRQLAAGEQKRRRRVLERSFGFQIRRRNAEHDDRVNELAKLPLDAEDIEYLRELEDARFMDAVRGLVEEDDAEPDEET